MHFCPACSADARSRSLRRYYAETSSGTSTFERPVLEEADFEKIVAQNKQLPPGWTLRYTYGSLPAAVLATSKCLSSAIGAPQAIPAVDRAVKRRQSRGAQTWYYQQMELETTQWQRPIQSSLRSMVERAVPVHKDPCCESLT